MKTLKQKAILYIAGIFAAVLCGSAMTAYAADTDTPVVDNGIPVIYLNIDETQGTIEDMNHSADHSVYCYGTISIDVPEGFRYSDFPEISLKSLQDLSMSIRGRGNSTWKNNKKPYKIKLDKKADVLGLGNNKHWVLVANALDPTLIRDRITAWLGDEMGFAFTPRGVPVDVVMTGQEFGTQYLGSYYLSENVRVGENRLEIAELSADDTDPKVITGGYLLQNALQVRDGSPDRFYTKRGVDWATDTPSFDTEAGMLISSQKETDIPDDEDGAGSTGLQGGLLTDAYENHVQQDYIQQYVRDFEDLLFDQGTAYRDYIDVESSAKYWLVQLFSLNNDGFGTGSTYIYKDRDPEGGISKFYWGPLWDFDYAWDYVIRTEGLNPGHTWLKPMFYDREEGGLVREIYKQWALMKPLIEKLIEEGGVIDQYYAETAASAAADHQQLHPETAFDYHKAVETLKTWIRERLAWFDENLPMIDTLIHKVTYISDGEIYATGFEGESAPLEIKLVPEKEGYYFDGWMDENGDPVPKSLYVTEDRVFTAKYTADSEMTHAEDIAFPITHDIVVYSPMFSAYSIRYEVIPADAEDQVVYWSSSNETFARVEGNGKVLYSGPGEVTLTATLRNGKGRTFTLTVISGEQIYAEGIEPEEEEIRMTVGDQQPCSFNAVPAPSKLTGFEYESEDESVVTVDEFGALKAVGPGQARIHIIAYTFDEDFNDVMLETYVTVIVEEKEEEPEDVPETGDPFDGRWIVLLTLSTAGMLTAGLKRRKVH